MLLGVCIWQYFTILTYQFQPFLNYRMPWFLGKRFKRGFHWLLTENGIMVSIRLEEVILENIKESHREVRLQKLFKDTNIL